MEVRAHTLGAKADILLSLAEARDAEEETATEHAFSEEDADQESGVQTNLTAEVATAQSFADEISAKFENKDITFEFLGYTDNVDNDAMAPPAKTEGDNPPFSLIFRSNGTCRPFKVRALTEEGDYLDVTVDVIGKAKIEEYGDDD